MRRIWLIAVLLVVSVSAARAHAQDDAPPAPTPTPAPDVMWYGKAPPGWGGPVTDFKMLAPATGWASRGNRYYWTTDGGAHWKDITPRIGPNDEVGSIFFLDTSRGWVIIDHHIDLYSGRLRFDLACSTDAGTTWSMIPSTIYVKDLPLAHAGGYDTILKDLKDASIRGGGWANCVR